MSEVQHTPEPWTLEEVGDKIKHLCPAKDGMSILTVALEYKDGEDDPTYLGAVWSPHDARRIVAAVNACRGVPTEKLEAVAAQDAPTPLANTLTAIYQRDEARALVKRMTAMLSHLGYYLQDHKSINHGNILALLKEGEKLIP